MTVKPHTKRARPESHTQSKAPSWTAFQAAKTQPGLHAPDLRPRPPGSYFASKRHQTANNSTANSRSEPVHASQTNTATSGLKGILKKPKITWDLRNCSRMQIMVQDVLASAASSTLTALRGSNCTSPAWSEHTCRRASTAYASSKPHCGW